jgi:hypothetical protein
VAEPVNFEVRYLMIHCVKVGLKMSYFYYSQDLSSCSSFFQGFNAFNVGEATASCGAHYIKKVYCSVQCVELLLADPPRVLYQAHATKYLSSLHKKPRSA